MRILLLFLIPFLVISCNAQDKQIYQETDLQSMTLSELRLKRNEIFARHGYIFRSQDLKDYFSNFEWYKPAYQNVDSLLTENDKANVKLILEMETEIKKFLIETDINIIDNYKKNESSVHKEFTERLINTIQNFQNRKADTTLIQIGNIDNIGELDTIINRIYYYDRDVWVNSSWTKNGIKMWEEKIKNPYLWINDSEEFQYDTRKPWVTFTIGIYYAIPELDNIDNYSHIDKQLVLQIGESWCKRKNIKISESEYSEYLDNFKGDIIAHGDPEIRHELLIWYEPIKDFLLFYAP